VPHVYLPGYHVGAQLRLSLAEVERYVQGSGAIGEATCTSLFTHNPLWAILGTDPNAGRRAAQLGDLGPDLHRLGAQPGLGAQRAGAHAGADG
jgi:hypothetical protein